LSNSYLGVIESTSSKRKPSSALDPMANVTNIKDRAPRVTKTEKAEAARLAAESNKVTYEDDLPM
jgi:hypothetical protein